MAGEIKRLYFADGVSVDAGVEAPWSEQVISDFLDFTHTATPDTPPASTLRVYAKSDNSLYAKTPAGVEVPIGSGAGGSGEKNYVENPSAASAITGWSNVGDLDVARTTTASELPREHTTGTGIKITADANTQSVADYVYYDFTLDDVDLNRKIKIQWDQKQFGAYVAGNLAVVITTQADRTTAVATPDVTAIPAYDGLFSASFDTASTATLSLVIRATTDMATDTGIVISDVIVGPGQIVAAAPIGPWESYTPTGSWVTNTTYAGRKRRVGDTMEYQVSLTLSGAPTSATLTINQPSGETIDSTKIANTSRGRLGDVVVYDNAAGGAARLLGEVAYNGTSNVACYVMDDASGSTHYEVVINATTPKTFAASDVIILNYSAPIAEFAGSPNYAGSNDVEYAYNTSSATAADDTTSFAYGPGGALIRVITATLSRRVRFTTPIQATDELTLEVSTDGIKWIPLTNAAVVNGDTIYPLSVQNASLYGAGRLSVINTTDVDVRFGQYVSPAGATYGAAGNAYTLVGGGYWRVKKARAGAAVGFGAATSDRLGLVKMNSAATTNNVGEYVEGTFTASLTGCTTVPTVTAKYVRIGKLVQIYIPSNTGTSNTTTATITGMPASIYPTSAEVVIIGRTIDSSVSTTSEFRVSTSGVITFYKNMAADNFTASGLKGHGGLSLIYNLT